MIITTTMHIENKPVQEYKGIVFGEVVEGRNFVKDFMSGIRDIVGGRSGSYEDSLMSARQAAIDEMAKRASKIGANAVIGVSFQYSTVGAQNGMLMVTCNGTGRCNLIKINRISSVSSLHWLYGLKAYPKVVRKHYLSYFA